MTTPQSDHVVGLASRAGGLWITGDSASLGSRSALVSCEPAVWLRGSGEILEIVPGPAGDRGWLSRVSAADPGPGPSFDRLAAIARRLRLPLPVPNPDDGRNAPAFRGGLVGCFSYDLGRRFEDVPSQLPEELPWDFQLGLYDEVIEIDAMGRITHHRIPGADGWLEDLWKTGSFPLPDLRSSALHHPIPEISKADHARGVNRIRELIRAGTIYQANLTFRMRSTFESPDTPLATFVRLVRDNPAPWAMFQDLPGVSVVSASPESFLDLTSSGHVRSRPIKGTTGRGDSPDRDRAQRDALLASPKDRSELAMIVDLVRNDIGRVCLPGSVNREPDPLAERHPTLWHLVSEVEGRLAPGRDAFDLLRAGFPPGSCIGAPKIRVMEVLEGLESSRRGPYTGALGWIGLDGTMSLSVAIRTVLFRNHEVSFGVGGGIVYDSRPEAEWREALLKGLALVRALCPSRPLTSLSIRQ